MWSDVLSLSAVFLTVIHTVSGLWCYKCHSSQAGCGSEMNIRLQRWQWCPDPGPGGYENFCVKSIENRGSEQFITRDCLMTFLKDTRHRQMLPNVRRHNYCSPARSLTPGKTFDESTVYCFCNDWNGCNSSTNLKAKLSLVSLMGLGVLLLLRIL